MNPQANMAAMNVAGGPVGGMQMMNGGMVRPEPNAGQDQLTMLNTYIYDYFLKKQHYGLARQLLKELSIKVVPGSKSSPNRNNVNGVDDSGDNKDDIQRPDDLPNANIPDDSGVDTCFLVDWWSQFWDIYSAQRGKANGRSQTLQYLQFNRQAKMNQQQEQQRLLMANRPMMGQRNGMIQSIPRAAMVNAQNATPNPLHNMQQATAMQMGKMQRDGAGMDINGQRPQSPANTENAPSPPKRPRLEGQNFNGQPMGPGRTQPMPGQPMNPTTAQATQMLLANGINPSTMSQEQINAFASTGQIPGKNMEGLNAAGGAPNNQMSQQGLDEQAFLNNGQGGMRQGGPQAQGPQGNHALQDYQMQLMLLEQQNKKRLLMARQEQDSMAQAPHGPGGVQLGQQGFAPAMSPQGSRAGPSPNPTDQMKRGTPKMGQNPLPGSPMPDGMQQNRASPIPNGNYDPSAMNQNMPPQFYQQMNQGNPMPNMRAPPSSHPTFQATPQQLEALRANGGRMPNGWPQGPPQLMQQQQQQGQQPQPVAMGTPQQRNPMGPPPAPPGGVEPGRTQPSSPAPPAAQPPTPNPTNKAAPKKKADAKPKKNPKKAAANATPSEEPTPTPSTPITPHPPAGSFNGQKPGQVQMGNGQQAPPLAGPPQQQIEEPFGTIPGPGQFGLDFPLDGTDVLESFDFDSFLQDTEEGNPFPLDGNFNFGADSVEAGTEI